MKKLKYLIAALLSIAAFSTGLWGLTESAEKGLHARKRNRILRKKETKRQRKKRMITKYAYHSYDAIKANQMLLLKKKKEKKQF